MNWHMFFSALVGFAFCFGIFLGAWLLATGIVYGSKKHGAAGVVLSGLFFAAMLGWIIP